MREDNRRQRKPGFRLFRRETVALGLVAASLFAAVPAFAGDDDDDEGSWSDRIGDSVKNTFSGLGKSVGLGGKPPGPPPSEAPSGCPPIAILEGTAGQRVMAAGGSDNQSVRYQFSLASVGRQCTVGGGRVSIKVAGTGRVLLGPAGSPGSFGVPVRVVVFSEAQQKPVVSKLFKVPSGVPAGQGSAPFRFVSDDITVPTSGNAVAEYSIKVGIDTGHGGGEPVAGKRSRRKAKPVASAQ